MFVGAVIIAYDGAGADINVLTHRGIADVAQVIDLAADTNLGLLHFDEIAKMHAVGDLRPWTQAGERPDAAFTPDGGFLDDAVGQDLGALAHRGVADHVIRPDVHPVAQNHLALENDVNVDYHITPAA